jgi:hypothetical protein
MNPKPKLGLEAELKPARRRSQGPMHGAERRRWQRAADFPKRPVDRGGGTIYKARRRRKAGRVGRVGSWLGGSKKGLTARTRGSTKRALFAEEAAAKSAAKADEKKKLTARTQGNKKRASLGGKESRDGL